MYIYIHIVWPCAICGTTQGLRLRNIVTTYGRRKLFYIKLLLHTPCIRVSMLVLGCKAGGMMNLDVADGVSERTQH